MSSDATRPLRVACIQMRSGKDPARNISAVETLIRSAAADGAVLIATPEMTNLLDLSGDTPLTREQDDASLAALREVAQSCGVWLLIGSLALAAEDRRKANRAFLIAPTGDIFARYDKINMFDVEIGDGQTYRESARFRPGNALVLAEAPVARIGLTICYDVRFPGLYRSLAQAGAEIIAIPAAFTKVTGKAHWHTLVRARAIETGAFVIAAAQGGRHEDGRETFGHSLIVSPWGEVISELASDAPGVIVAEIDLDDVQRARARIPSLARDAAFLLRIERGEPQAD